MNPFDLVGIPCVNPPVNILLDYVIREHRADISNFFIEGRDYKPTFVIIHRYREEGPYIELRFFWKRMDGTAGNNVYYFIPSVYQILKPISEPKGKLESFITRRQRV